MNLTRGLTYRHAPKWHNDDARYMQGILRDFKVNIRARLFQRENNPIILCSLRNKMFELLSAISIKRLPRICFVKYGFFS